MENQLLPGDLSETHWQPPVLFNMSEMESAILALDAFETGLQYYIGDACIFARDHYGDKWTQIIPEHKADTWRQYMYVCERVSYETRKRLPSYSHARAVASLPPEDQISIIDTLPAGSTTREVEKAVAARKPAKKAKKKPWPVALLTWGRIKQMVEAQEGMTDDTPVIINIGPDANNVTWYEGSGENTTVYLEGWKGDESAALCFVSRNEML